MNTAEIFKQSIEKKKRRLEELARQPRGKRFLHHTVISVEGVPTRSSIPYTIVKYGLLNLRDRKANPETSFDSSNTWDNTHYQPVFLMDDSYNSFRVGSMGSQMLTFLVDSKILENSKYYKTDGDGADWLDSYVWEIGIDDSILPENILGAIVPGEGHNILYHFQTRPNRDPEELEKEDKENYNSYDRKTGRGTIKGAGLGAFYRGLLWGMEEFPQNAFPIFTGFHSSHFPYEAGRGIWSGEQATLENEIPFEYYLTQQIFPLTQEALLQQIFVDMARKKGASPRDIGIAQRVAKGIIAPEQALGREMTPKEKIIYAKVDPKYEDARKQMTAEMALDSQDLDPWEGLDVYERRKLILGESAR